MSHPLIHRLPATAVAAVTLAAGLGACGSSGGSDSKPGYCNDKNNLQQAVDDLSKVNLRENGVSALRSQVEKIRVDAEKLAASAKDEFPDQTKAITTSVAALRSSVTALPSSPSVQDVATIGANVAGVVSSVKDLGSAAGDACS